MHAQLIWKCPVCQRVACIPDWAKRIVCACGYIQLGITSGLGDHVAAILHRVGITPEKYVAAKAALGLKRKCRCPQRQQRLNELGRKIGIGN